MKKILISTLLLLGTISFASAEVGLKIGVSGNVGVYEASGFEMEGTEKNIHKDNEEMVAGMGSIFIEKTLDFLPGPLARLSIGYDYVPYDIQTGSISRTDANQLGQEAAHAKETNIVKATLKNINTAYLTVSLTDFLYIKAGLQEMDVETNEDLQTGSDYKNTSIDGYLIGIGAHIENDNGFFARLEINQTELDGAKLISTTNTDNSVTLEEVSGMSARVSIGKSF